MGKKAPTAEEMKMVVIKRQLRRWKNENRYLRINHGRGYRINSDSVSAQAEGRVSEMVTQ